MRKIKGILALVAVLFFAGMAPLAAEDYSFCELDDMSIDEFRNFFGKAWQSQEDAYAVSNAVWDGELLMWPMAKNDLTDVMFDMCAYAEKKGKGKSKNKVYMVSDGDYIVIAHNSWDCWFPFRVIDCN